MHVADVDGDGKADVIDPVDGAAYANVWLSNGDYGSFRIVTAQAGYTLAGARMKVGDFNGDGKADAIDPIDGSSVANVWLSNGDGTFSIVGYEPWAGYAVGSSRMAAGDFDGDGRTDMLDTLDGSMGVNVWLSTGDGTFHVVAYGAGYPVSSRRVRIADVDGNGKADVVDPRDGSSEVQLWTSPQAADDLLSSIVSPLGGATSFSYAPSSTWANTNGPPITQTLVSVTLSNGIALTDPHGWSSTTGFSYAGGLWDPIERRFLGFHYVNTALPCIGWECRSPGHSPRVESWFHQDYGSASRPDRVDRRDGYGNLLTSTIHQYTTNGFEVPYTSQETRAGRIHTTARAPSTRGPGTSGSRAAAGQ
jgi:hypothetical protein